jgi:hypothetical protein
MADHLASQMIRTQAHIHQMSIGLLHQLAHFRLGVSWKSGSNEIRSAQGMAWIDPRQELGKPSGKTS